MPEPLYTSANCSAAYQLHWSLTAFAAQDLPPIDSWLDQLRSVTESDEIRILECHVSDGSSAQFFVSTRPPSAPAAITRLIKGRLQYLLRQDIPQLWRRHSSISSVGSANDETLQSYVGRQVEHHPMADPRVVERLAKAQYFDPAIDLAASRPTAHGRFLHNLHVALKNADQLNDVREDWLQTTRAMLIAACQKKGWLLSRIGIVGNHLHVLVGCGVTETPEDVVLCLMNNLAYAHGMKRVFAPSYFVGTFGSYDDQAIRRNLAVQ